MIKPGPISVPGDSFESELDKELLRLSVLAMGRTAPNPAVAAVAVAQKGAGWTFFGGCTEVAGGRHAEVVALDLAAAHGANPSHLYVTLEPCSRFGRTPPCTERIIASDSLKEVTYYTTDVSLGGEGRRALEQGGRTVHDRTGDSRYAAAFLKGFTSRAAVGIPRLHMKMARTYDDVIGHRAGRIMISGPGGLRLGMLLRAKFDAVLVGPRTIITDNPGLDFRPPPPFPEGAAATAGERADVLLGSILRWSRDIEEAAVAEEAYQPRRLFVLGRRFADSAAFFAKQAMLSRRTQKEPSYFVLHGHAYDWPEVEGATVLPELDDAAFGSEIRGALGAMGLNDVLIEGGARLATALLPLRPGDRLYRLQAKKRSEELSGQTAKSQALVRFPEPLLEMPDSALFDLGTDTVAVVEA